MKFGNVRLWGKSGHYFRSVFSSASDPKRTISKCVEKNNQTKKIKLIESLYRKAIAWEIIKLRPVLPTLADFYPNVASRTLIED